MYVCMNGAMLTGNARHDFRNLCIIPVRFERQKVGKKSKPTRRLKHANLFETILNISAKYRQN